MNAYKNEIQIAALAIVCLGLSIISKSPSVGFVMGATFVATANRVRKIF